MSGPRRALLLAACVGLLGGCQSAPLPEGVPALIVGADHASRDELQRVVSTALSVPRVTLAPDALTAESVLSVEHSPPREIGAPPATGRLLGRPELFRLLRDGPDCVLLHERTGMRWLLLDTDCVPE